MASLRRLWADLTGRSDDRFIELLDAQIAAVLDAVAIIRAALSDWPGSCLADVERLETVGDDRRAELIRELSKSLTTPIDREDLFRLSRSVDDVLDNLHDFAREMDLYEPANRAGFDAVLEAVAKGMDGLHEAIARFSASPQEVLYASRAAKDGASLVRTRYEDAMARVLHAELTTDTMRERELLRRLDVVGLRLGEAADALADGTLKRVQ
ncbi:MAG TPA: DUF47 family protein [Acidimicrobiia bacterium]|nr:DUF47 family protein [Acidimicrobiia bacterium]